MCCTALGTTAVLKLSEVIQILLQNKHFRYDSDIVATKEPERIEVARSDGRKRACPSRSERRNDFQYIENFRWRAIVWKKQQVVNDKEKVRKMLRFEARSSPIFSRTIIVISRRRSPTAVGFKQWSNFATQDGLMMAGTGFHSLSLFGDFLPALPRPLLDQRQDKTCSLRKRA